MTFLLAALLAVSLLHKNDFYHTTARQDTENASGNLAGFMAACTWVTDAGAQSAHRSQVRL